MRRSTLACVKYVLSAALCLFLGALCAQAQLTDTGTIVGTVTDQSGAAIPDTKVTVTDLGTNIQQIANTDAAGQYVVPSLKVGTYSVTVEKQGFQTYVQSGVIVNVQSRVQVDVKLQVGSVTQQVQVTAAAPLLNTQSAEIGQVVGSQKIVDLPLNTRQYDALVFLSPGITVASSHLNWRTNAGEGYFDANGNQAMQNNFILDGADNNSLVENFQGKSAQAGQPPVDAVAEFKLQTRTYDAEFGRNAGAVVNAQIKSGTNQLHGDAWEFVRNSKLDASDFFANRAGAKKPIFQQNQFGGTLGGPIIKDKAFVFGAFERTPLRLGVTQLGGVPTPLMRQGNFSEFPVTPKSPAVTGLSQFANCFNNAIINPSCIDPVGQKLFNLYPLPNTNRANEGIPGKFAGNNFIASPKETENVNNGTIRADQKIGQKDSLFEHYTVYDLFEHYPYIFQEVNPIADGATDISIWDVRNQNAALGLTHIFNPTTVLDFRLGYNRMRENAYPFNFGKIVNPDFGIKGIPVIPGVSGGLPQIEVAGFSGLGGSRWTPMIQKSYVWQYRGILSKIKGAHTLKMGAEFRRDARHYLDDCCFRGYFGFNGQYTGGAGTLGATDLLLGVPNSVSLSNYAFVRAYQNGLFFFGQDTWRVTPKLTVNYGLRWELVTPELNRDNRISNFNPALNNGQGGYFAVPPNASGVAQRATVENYKRGFAPRMGLAYRINEKLVFRGGYGIFYQNYDRRGSQADLHLNPPWLVSYAPGFSATQPPAFLLQQGFPANTLDPPNISNPADIAASQLFGQDFHTRYGMVQQSSAGFEYSLMPNMVLSTSWVGNYGHRMWRAINLNQKILDTPGQPSGHIPFPAFAINPTGLPLTQVSPSGIQWEQSDGNSKYNALLVSLEKRYAQGLSLVLSYTWSKGLADYTGNLDSGFRNGSPQDNLNRRNDWGLQAMDTPHRFVASATYALPFGRSATSRGMRLLGGWQVNGILTFASGQPIGIGAPYDASQTGTGERANCVGNKNGGPKTVDQWFDTSGYFVPPIYTFGTCSPTPGPRNPGINNLDASLFKDFTITERVKLQFRAESYNFVNHPQFGPPNGGCSASISSTNPTGACAGSGSFGSISSLNVNVTPRQIQFGLKLIF